MVRESLRDKVTLLAIYAVLSLCTVSVVFPLMYVLSVSVTPYSELLKQGGFLIVPRQITFEAYRVFLNDWTIPRAYYVTTFITVVGTAVNLVLTTSIAYPLSKRDLPGRSQLLFLIAFTLLFSGGIIPTYLIVKATGLIDSLWAMIVPGAIWTFNLLVMKTFFEGLPDELFEAARIDGAGEVRIMLRLAVPLSLPVMMTVGLFYAVGHWNEFYQGLMYMTSTKNYPLQVILRAILVNSMKPPMDAEEVLPTKSLEMAAVVLTALPIVVVYPFVQRYFMQGMMIGSIKG